MIMRRPEIWGTMGGEVIDDERSSEAIGIVAGMQEQEQQQYAPAVESSRPASSGGNVGWGSRAELLLVSAVKKHGVPNWNLVALELKARAILLDVPPSYFSDEACQYRYNALKGKFARDGGVGSRDDDLNGVSWFEELRKLRMSHLKEELQCYDSSIVQLQSRINKLNEERAQCPSLQSVVVKQNDSSYGADTNSKVPKHSDSKITTGSLRSEESIIEQPQASAAKNSEQPDPEVAVSFGRENSIGEIADGGQEFRKDGVLAIAIQASQGAAVDEMGSVADATEKKGRASSESPRSGGGKYEKRDDQVDDKCGENEKTLRTVEQEIIQRQPLQEEVDHHHLGLEQESFQQNPLAQEAVNEESAEQASSAGTGALDSGQGTARGVLSCALQALEEGNASRGDDVIHAVNEPSNGGDEKFQDTGDRSGGGGEEKLSGTGDSSGGAVCSTSRSQSVPAESTQNLSSGTSAETLFVACDPPPGSLEADASHGKGDDHIESSMVERPLSRLSLAYGKAEKAKKEKIKEAAKSIAISRPNVNNEPGQSQVAPEVSEMPKAESIDTRSTDKLSEQSERNRISPLDTAPSDEVWLPARQQGAADVSAKGFEDGTDEGTSVKASHPRVVDVPQGDSDFGRREGAEPMSLVVDLLPVAGTVTQTPEQDRDEPLISSSGHRTSGKQGGDEDVLRSQTLIEVKSENETLEEMPNEATSEICVISASNAPADAKDEQLSPVADVVRFECATAKMLPDEGIRDIEHDQEVKEAEKAEMDTVYGGEEIGPRDRDTSATRSTGDNNLGVKGSGSTSEERRDSTEIGEGRQLCPENTDSQVDKSEVGSSMDSVEDMSPSSRKSRREPKVPGKFLPLLECLRVICAHKFAPLFRQKQEYQESAEYDRLVRRHVDLSMVRARLEDGAYSGSVEFFRDLLLIFTNALVYSNSESQEYAGAKVLRRCALAEMDKILQTEALLKQNGPATRKREGKKSAEVHKPRASSTLGTDAAKRGTLKGSNNETVIAPDVHVGSKNAPAAFDNTTLQGGKASNSSGQEQDVDGAPEDAKKLASTRLERDEIPRKDSRKPEYLHESNRNGNSRKKVKVESAIKKSDSLGQVTVDLRTSGGRLKVEKTPANTKDVMCTDVEKKGPISVSASVAVPPRLPTGNRQQKTQSLLRQTSTSRVSRSSKRAGDSTLSNPKKRVRK